MRGTTPLAYYDLRSFNVHLFLVACDIDDHELLQVSTGREVAAKYSFPWRSTRFLCMIITFPAVIYALTIISTCCAVLFKPPYGPPTCYFVLKPTHGAVASLAVPWSCLALKLIASHAPATTVQTFSREKSLVWVARKHVLSLPTIWVSFLDCLLIMTLMTLNLLLF